MPRKKSARARKQTAAPRVRSKTRSTTRRKTRTVARQASSLKPAAPKRRGRPPGSKSKTAQKKRAPRGSLLKQLLEKERRIKQRWHEAARNAKQVLHDLQVAHRAAEQRAVATARMAEAKAKALQSFAEKWERKYLAKLAKRQHRAARPGGRRRRSA